MGKIEVVRRESGRAPARGQVEGELSESCPGSDEPLKCFPQVRQRGFPCGSALAFFCHQPWLVTCDLSAFLHLHRLVFLTPFTFDLSISRLDV
jgi:hypothetical protein